MAKIYRNSKVMKFVDSLRTLQNKENEHALNYGNHFIEQSKELFNKRKLGKQDNLQIAVVDIVTEHSYEKGSISFTHSQFSLFLSMMFHLGSVSILESMIKEMGDFFDLDIPERRNGDDEMEKYRIKSINTLDYSNIQRSFLLIVGGVGEGYSQEIQEKCEQIFMEVIKQFVDANEIERTDKGFVVKTALQNIPSLTSELVKRNVGLYGVIPVEELELEQS